MSESTISRRGLLRAGGVAVAGTAAVSAAGTASAQSDYGGWLDDVGNYDGSVVDATGQDSVTIEVGAQGNNGPNAFGPPAVQVNPGTTVVWEWVEGSHNVVDEGGNFESDITAEVGFTFEQTFDETGVVEYYCAPHRAMGMKGVVDVVEGSGGGGSGGGGDAESAPPSGPAASERMGSTGDGTVGGLVVAGLAIAFASPALFGAFLKNRDLGDGPDGGSR